MAKTAREEAQKNIAENRKAFHDYHILDTWEAGVALLGTEVKSIREGAVNLRDSFARVESGEVWIYNVHINPYSHRGYADHEPTRKRKLLLHRREIDRLYGQLHDVLSWMTELVWSGGPAADERRARVFARIKEDPTGFPDASGQGPFGPCDEEARRLILGLA